MNLPPNLPVTTSPTAASGSPVAATVVVNPSACAGAMLPGAVGLSFEKDTVPMGLFSADNAKLIALFKLLGPGVLRLGGDSVESVVFDPNGAGGVRGRVAPPDLVKLAGFAAATGWSIIYGTPFLGPNVPSGSVPGDGSLVAAAAVAVEARAAAAALGASLQAFELCNEPDCYLINRSCYPAVWSAVENFNARWAVFAAAVRVAVPGAVFTGPAPCFLASFGSWSKGFLAQQPGQLCQLTQHYYRGFGIQPQTSDVLLAEDLELDAALALGVGTAVGVGLARGFRLTETNSFGSGGQDGVSNTFASALWGAWHALRAGAAGATGVNFHNSGNCPPGLLQPHTCYAAISLDYDKTPPAINGICPLFYGLLLAAQAGSGPMPTVAISPFVPALRAYAVRNEGGPLRVVLINMGADALSVVLDPGGAAASATALILAAPRPDASTTVTLGDAMVGTDGSWLPTQESLPLTAGSPVTVQLQLPAYAAMLVKVTLNT